MIAFIARKIFGSVNDRIIKSFKDKVDKVNAFESSIGVLSDQNLRAKTTEFKDRLSRGETLDQILPEAFAVVRESAKRTIGMRHFDVQLIGGMVLHQGKISEMRTGEGKTLVSTLPAYLNALSGKGVHIVTVNDYLAQRDSKWMGRVHEFLGLSVGCITNNISDEMRKQAYNCDITYATNNELGFDYLRDNMKFSEEEMVQRGHNFAIVDEVDSILIDEARTPLIISGPTNDNSKLYEDINRLIPVLKESDFQLEEKERGVFLTEVGIDTMEKLLKKSGILPEVASLYDVEYMNIVHHANQALKAHKIFRSEIDYIVKDNSVIIIDEFTGRMQEGRRFSDGLHQALEAKEGVRIRNENQTLASITFQNYFRLYKKLAGMTGTAATEAVEFEEIYGLRVVAIPTHLSIARIDEDDEIYKTEQEKYNAIIRTIEDCHQRKQPILVGTVSIEKSERIAKLLAKNGLPYNILNAKYHEKEAHIIAQAGVPGAITIATNMAGRGTDIMLGGNPEMVVEELSLEMQDQAVLQQKIAEIKVKIEADKKTVIEAGGLYVLGTERHESRRIDNQLRGRSGRQGDPGKSKFFLSLEDDLMRIFGSDKLKSMLSTLGLKDDEAIFHPWITKTLEKAQKKVEVRNYEIRKNLIKYDDVVNEQRKIIFERRTGLIRSENVSAEVAKIQLEINQDIVLNHIPKNSYPDQWDIEGIENEIQRIYGLRLDVKSLISKEGAIEREVLDFVNNQVEQLFISKQNIYGEELEKQLQKQLYLMTLDSEWKDHLSSLDRLRHGINLRAYAQKDPLMEYKRDAYALFEEMLYQIEEKLISRLAHARLNHEAQESERLDLINKLVPKQSMFETRSDPALLGVDLESKANLGAAIKTNIKPEDRDPNNIASWGSVGRNEPCPCKSGKKYKYCHGVN